MEEKWGGAILLRKGMGIGEGGRVKEGRETGKGGGRGEGKDGDPNSWFTTPHVSNPEKMPWFCV